MENIDYQFTAVPTKLMILLDVNCRSMLFTLCQLSSNYADKEGKFLAKNLLLQPLTHYISMESSKYRALVRAMGSTLIILG